MFLIKLPQINVQAKPVPPECQVPCNPAMLPVAAVGLCVKVDGSC